MRTALVLLILAALAAAGDYEPPVPRPGGLGPEATPAPDAGDEGTDPGPVPPSALPPPTAPRTGLVREDTRLTLRIWWEANRHRHLPPIPELPVRNEMVAALLTAAKGDRAEIRDRALLALGRAGAMQAFDRFRRDAGAGSAELSACALIGLGLLGDDTASPILRRVALDAGASISDRAFALLALGLLGDAEDTAFLREAALEEWQGDVRSAAVLGVGLHRDAGGANLLGRLLLGVTPPAPSPFDADGGSPAAIPALAAAALGEILTPSSYDYLVWAADRGEPAVRGACVLPLSRARGTAGRPALLRALDERSPLSLRQVALGALAAEGGAGDAARAILESEADQAGLLGPFAGLVLAPADSAAEGTRAGGALGAAIRGEKEGIPAAERLLAESADADVVGLALVADALLGGAKAAPFAVKALRSSTVPELRRDAATALGILGAKEGVEPLVAALSDPAPVAAEAARALARIDGKRAAAELLRRLADPDADVARSAALALGDLLDRERPGRLTVLLSRVNLLSDANLAKAIAWIASPHLYALVWQR